MKLHTLFIVGICVFGGSAALADDTNTPELLSGITGDVKVLSATESAGIRGEYFSTYRGMSDFCNNNRDECDSRYYSYTKKKWAALDRRKWRTDVTRNY